MDMHGGMGSDGGSSCKISMLWNWYTIDACFLVPGWRITNGGMFAASCIGVILLVVLRGGVAARRPGIRRIPPPPVPAARSDSNSSIGAQGSVMRATMLQQLTRALLHALTFGCAYVVMLLAMYFNGYILICIFLGAGLGKFFCDWLVVKIGPPGDLVTGAAKGIEESTICCG